MTPKQRGLSKGNSGVEDRCPDQLPCLLQTSRTVLLVVRFGDEVHRVIPLKSFPGKSLSPTHAPWLPCKELIMLTE